MTYVYLLYAGGYIKVGVSHSVNKRIKTLQTGCPFEIKLVCKGGFLDSKEAYLIEKEIHDYLKDKGFHSSNEWFLMDMNTLDYLIHHYQLNDENGCFIMTMKEEREEELLRHENEALLKEIEGLKEFYFALNLN